MVLLGSFRALSAVCTEASPHLSDSFKAKLLHEGHSPGPLPPNPLAPIYSVTGAMRTSGAFSAAYPALYLRQLDLGGIRLSKINALLFAVLAVVEVPVRPALAPLLQLQHPAAIGSPLDDGA
jgi:hypothetical protein